MKRSTTPRVKDRLADLLRPTGEEDLLAVSYPAPRWRVSIRQAIGGVCALGLIVVILLGTILWRGGQGGGGPASGTTGELPELPALAAESGGGITAGGAGEGGGMAAGGTGEGGVGPSGTAHPSEQAEIVVSVVGAVERPGVMTLAPGARVEEALRHAKPYQDAQVSALNLAQRLNDGEQIAVPAAGEEGSPAVCGSPSGGAGAAGAGGGSGGSAGGSGSAGAAGGSGKLALNAATAADLTALPGVGQKTAEAIIAHRDSIGGFRSVEQLLDVKGIGPAKFDSLKDHVRI